MDYYLKIKNLSNIKLTWIILSGQIRNIRLKTILVDSIPVIFQDSYVENENELRRLTRLPAITVDSLTNRKNRYCIIYRKDELIGSILCYRMLNECVLNFLFVSETYRQRNIGKLLIALIIKDQIKNHSEIDKFVTDPTHDIARKILTDFKFRPQIN